MKRISTEFRASPTHNRMAFKKKGNRIIPFLIESSTVSGFLLLFLLLFRGVRIVSLAFIFRLLVVRVFLLLSGCSFEWLGGQCAIRSHFGQAKQCVLCCVCVDSSNDVRFVGGK